MSVSVGESKSGDVNLYRIEGECFLDRPELASKLRQLMRHNLEEIGEAEVKINTGTLFNKKVVKGFWASIVGKVLSAVAKFFRWYWHHLLLFVSPTYRQKFEAASTRISHCFFNVFQEEVSQIRHHKKLAGNCVELTKRSVEACKEELEQLEKTQWFSPSKWFSPEKRKGRLISAQEEAEQTLKTEEERYEILCAQEKRFFGEANEEKIVGSTYLPGAVERAARVRCGIAMSSAPLEKFLDTVKEKAGDEFAQVWRAYFSNFTGQGAGVQSLTHVGGNKYRLQLNSRLKLWVNSTDAKGVVDPPGGIVLLLGDEKAHRVEFDLFRGQMKFHSGFTIQCVGDLEALRSSFPKIVALVRAFSGRFIEKESAVCRLEVKEGQMNFKAGAKIAGYELAPERLKDVDYLKKNWGPEHAEVVIGGHRAFIRKKFLAFCNELNPEHPNWKLDKQYHRDLELAKRKILADSK